VSWLEWVILVVCMLLILPMLFIIAYGLFDLAARKYRQGL